MDALSGLTTYYGMSVRADDVLLPSVYQFDFFSQSRKVVLICKKTNI